MTRLNRASPRPPSLQELCSLPQSLGHCHEEAIPLGKHCSLPGLAHVDDKVLGGCVQAARQGDGLGDVLQREVGQVDLLGQSDGHLATVTREGPAVARCHVGLEGQVQGRLCWVGG